MNTSQLRSFAITSEHIAGLLPRWVSKNGLRKAEAEHFARQLRTGAEIALDIAAALEKTGDDPDEQRVTAAALAMRNSSAWPAVFRSGTAETLARCALIASGQPLKQ